MFPSPWNGSANVIFKGCTGACAFDGGAIEAINNTGSAVTIQSVTVQLNAPGDTSSCVVQTPIVNVTVPAGQTVIGAQQLSGAGSGGCPTAASELFNTSDSGPNGSSWAGKCTNSGVVPVISAIINGATATVTDSGQVLNTGGVDVGGCSGGANESRPWTSIGVVPADSLVNGGSNAASPQIPVCPYGNYPVDCATGDFWHTFHELSVPGRGVPLDLSLTYNSLAAAQSSAVGFGWTFGYDANLAVNPGAGTATVTQENGATVAFTLVSGAWQPPPYAAVSLVQNPDGTFTFMRRHDGRSLVFSAAGQLQSITDRNGYKTSLTYTSGRLTSVSDPAGRSLSFSYGTNGDVSQVTDPAGRMAKLGYSPAGDLSSITDPNNGVTQLAYAGGPHLVTSMTDPRNDGSVLNVYDGQGRVVQQTDPAGRVTTFGYAGGTTTITDPRGNITEEHFSDLEPVAITRALGTSSQATWTYSYDPSTLALASATDPNGHTTSYTSDGDGNITSVSDPLGHGTTTAYNGFDEPTSIKDALNVTTTLSYDASGNLQTVSMPLVSTGQTRTTSYSYTDPAHPGDVTAVTNPNGKTSHYVYDAQGNLTSSTDPLGDQTTYGYACTGGAAAGCFPNVGLRYTTVSPRGNVSGGTASQFTTAYSYNPFGEPVTITDQRGHQTKYAYDGNGNRTQVTDANNHLTGYTYDPDNELTKITRADLTVLQSAYDADGNLQSQTDAASNPTSYAYDPLNHLQSVTDPLHRTTSYVYDAVGNLKSITDPQARTTSDSYDAANRLMATTYSDGQTPAVSYGYDADNRRISVSDGVGGSYGYSYDSLGRLTQVTDIKLGNIGYGYDLAGNQTQITYPNGKLLTQTFDDAGRLQSVKDWLGASTSFGYDPNSNLQTITFPAGSGNKDTYTYDSTDRMLSVAMNKGSSALASATYTRDNIDQLQIVAARAGKGSTTTTTDAYNTINQLTSSGTNLFAYNPADDPTELNARTGYGYDTANQLTALTATKTLKAVSYTYDTLGERTASTITGGASTSYGYDQAQHLTTFTAPNITDSYTYDGNGLETAHVHNGTSTNLAWDQSQSLPLILDDGQASVIYGPGGIPVEQIDRAGTPLYFHHDQQGSTTLLTSATGASTGTASYTPYGTATTTGTTTPFGYDGQYTDPNTGLINLRARQYDPATAQFLTRDPLAPVTREPYSYAFDNSLNGIDPSGLDGFLGTGIGPDVGPSILPTPGQVVAAAGSVASTAVGVVASAAPTVAPIIDAAAGTACVFVEPCGVILGGATIAEEGLIGAQLFATPGFGATDAISGQIGVVTGVALGTLGSAAGGLSDLGFAGKTLLGTAVGLPQLLLDGAQLSQAASLQLACGVYGY